MYFERSSKKGSRLAAFFFGRALYFPAWTTKKKRAGRGGSARTGKSLRGVNSKERVRSRNHLQAQRNFLSAISARFQFSESQASRYRSSWYSGSVDCTPLIRKNRGTAQAFFHIPLLFNALAAGMPHTMGWCVNALWGKLMAMAVTKCIGLQVDESAAHQKTAF